MPVRPKAVLDKKAGSATPQFASGGDDNPADYDVPGNSESAGSPPINQWQQKESSENWSATADVELKNGKATIPLQLIDDSIVEGKETIKWTISDSAAFGFEKKKYTFTEGDAEVSISLSDDKKSRKNKTVTIEIEDNDTVTGGSDAGASDDDTVTGGANTGTLNNDTVTGGADAGTLENDLLTGGAGANTFVINSPSEGIDKITDFTESEGNKLLNSARGFGGELAEGDLLAFTIVSTAANASEPFIYDLSTGGLLFDVDGEGGFGQTRVVL